MSQLCFLPNLTSEEWAAWAQAIFSAVAIFSSVLLVNHQHKLELRRIADEESQHRRHYLDSAFQLIGAVYQVILKVVQWSKGGEIVSEDLHMIRIELDGLIEALRQTDYGRFDEHTPIEATLVALSSARRMLSQVTPSEYAGNFTSAKEIGEMASDLCDNLKEHLDKIRAMRDET